MALAASELERLVTRGGRPAHLPGHAAPAAAARAKALPLSPALDAALPEAGLPRGAVIEVASVHGLARATSIAVAACASAQRVSLAWAARPAWCAWLDPWGTLHAPGLRAAGIALERLLVVRPDVATLARTAVRVAASGAFAVVVIDTVSPLDAASSGSAPPSGGVGSSGSALSSGADGSSGGAGSPGGAGSSQAASVRLDRWPTVVRRLALAVEGTETIVVLLTDLAVARGLPLPVSLRLEVERRLDPAGGRVCSRSSLRVAKERHGRVGGVVPIDELAPRSEPSGDLRSAPRSATSRG
jgi:recombination protein RecA